MQARNKQSEGKMVKYWLVMAVGLLMLPWTVSAEPIIEKVAGNGTGGYSGDGGAATATQIKKPTGVVLESSGSFYIADTYNHRIRKVDASGIISTVAGTGTQSYSGDDGPATAAELNEPTSVAFDSSGNLYIADCINSRIRMVNTSGVIRTIAGNGTWAYTGDGGPATAAAVKAPAGVAVSSGNLYIADTGNHCIRKIDSSGNISTVAGTGTSLGYSGDTGPATAAKLTAPSSVAVDSSGNLYIADTFNHCIRKVDTSDNISTVAGIGTQDGYTGDGGAATAAKLNQPNGVATDNSNIYIADSGNNCIRKVDSSGIISTVAGNGTGGYSGDGGAATAAMMYTPKGVALDSSGSIFIADTDNHLIRKVSTAVLPTTTTSVNSSTTTVPGETTTTTTTGGKLCPARQVLGADNPQLENLCDFRDSKLAKSATGRKFVQLYYNNAESVNAALERSPALRAVARRVLETIAPLLGR